MKEQTPETVIEKFFKATLHLITADMKDRKLIQAFTTIGLDTSPYETHLDQDAFLLAGIGTENQVDDLRDWYYTQIEQILEVEITNRLSSLRATSELNPYTGESIEITFIETEKFGLK